MNMPPFLVTTNTLDLLKIIGKSKPYSPKNGGLMGIDHAKIRKKSLLKQIQDRKAEFLLG